MITAQMHYPGDPPQIIFLMFGKEFRERVRGDRPGEINIKTFEGGITEEFKVVINEIRCDQCGGEIKDEEPLALTGVPSKVYCWPCHTALNNPYLVRVSPA